MGRIPELDTHKGFFKRRWRRRREGVVAGNDTHYYKYSPLDRCSNCTLWDRELGGQGFCMRHRRSTWFNSLCKFFRRKRDKTM